MPRKLLRTAGVLGASLLLHAVLAAALLGSQLVRLLPNAPALEIEVVSTPPKALPLGPPAAAPAPAPAPLADAARAPRKKRAPRPPPTPDAGAADADLPPDAQAALAAGADAGLPQGLRAEGPEGARLVVRLRLDRLREAPRSQAFMALTDTLLRLLPDRRRLLEGSGLDLFADFDALIVATPNPLDDAVTFLGVRHHLEDGALMQALGRAATGAGRPIEWTEMRGRPVGLRPSNARQTRDDRVFVLPEAGWAVIAPQAYVSLLLPELSPAGDGKAAEESFAALAARLRGEENAMPPDAVLSAAVSDMLSAGPGRQLDVPGAGPLPVPSFIEANVSLSPTVALELRLGFAARDDTARWMRALPELRRQHAGHPLVLLGGMSAVIGRIELDQVSRAENENLVLIRAPMDHGEAERILTLITNLLRGQLGR